MAAAEADGASRRSGVFIRYALVALAGLAAGGLIAWALVTVLAPPSPAPAAKYTLVTVRHGQVGATISLDATARWNPVLIGTNQASGVVTSVSMRQGERLTPGTELYAVDERPVVAAQGEVPMYRDIDTGASGGDVRQLQGMLRALGFYSGPLDGTASAGTVAAIRAWQASEGVPSTGTVHKGDVIFVPKLPVAAVLDTDTVFRGEPLTGGEQVLRGLPAAPAMSIPVTASQQQSIADGAAVTIRSGAHVWEAHVASARTDAETGGADLILASDGGGPICGDACGTLSPTSSTLLPATITTVPKVVGLIVPTSAVHSTASDTTYVVARDGSRHSARVVTTADGESVVSGVTAGLVVRIPDADAE